MRHILGKGTEALLDILDAGEKVEVIRLNVQYHGDRGVKLQKRIIILARLHDDGVSVADTVAGLQKRQSAAYHDGGVFLGRHENVSAHRSGRGLAVRAGNAQGIFIPLHYGAPSLRALEHGDAHLMRSYDLGVIFMGGGSSDDKLRIGGDVRCIVADEDLNTLAAEI